MSAHDHASASDAGVPHDHAFEGIPADRPQPDEPRSPGWLPLLGIGLLLAVLLAYVATRPAGKTSAELAKVSEPEPGASAMVAAPAPPTARPIRRPPGGMPSAFLPGTLPSALRARPGAPRPPAAPKPPGREPAHDHPH